MNSYQKTADETLKELKVEKDKGLTSQEVENRIKEHGLNQFTPPEEESFFKKVLDSLSDPMILILIVAAFISIGLNTYKHFTGSHTEFAESIGIIVAIIIASSIALIMEGRSAKAFKALNDVGEDIQVKVLRNGEVEYVHKKDITIGDLVFLETGDKAPADGRLIDSFHLKVNESMLTGESETVSKDHTKVYQNEETPLAERKNLVYGGTFVTEGKGLMIITDIGDNTEMGKIAGELSDSEDAETPLQEKLGDLGKKISIIGSIVAGIIFLIEVFKMWNSGVITFEGVQNAFVTSIALIVAAVPEGLPTMVAITLAINMVKMSKQNALVKKLIAVETIGAINVIASDKTGTLTKNQMTVVDVWEEGKFVQPKEVKSSNLLDNFCSNSTAHLHMENGKVEFIGNPTEGALLETYEKTVCGSNDCNTYGSNYKNLRNRLEVAYQYAFSSDRKSMTTVIKTTEGFKAYIKGSPEKVLSLCSKVVLDGKVVDLTPELLEQINEGIMSLQKDAKRVLGFAYKDTNELNWEDQQDDLEKDMVFTGFVGIQDPLRDDVIESVERSRKAGIELKMLTGDNKLTATAIAKQLGILKEDSLILESNEIDEMSDEELMQKIDRIKIIARSKPLTKMRIVNVLKKMGNVVAVTGDGINDAPALKNADVGVAMGIAGTEVSKEASDIVLIDDSFSTIVKAVNWGRAIYENFQRFIQFQLTVNVVAFLTAILATLSGFPLPFTTLQLLWVNIIMDGPPALTLGLESPRKHLMKNKPIERNASIITKDMLYRIVIHGVYMVGMLMLLMFVNPLGYTPEQQGTVVFTTFALFQLFNAFNSREFGTQSIFPNLLKNKVMLFTMLITFAIQIAVTQFGGNVFKTVPLDFVMWLKIIGYASTVIVFSEVVKLGRRVLSK